MMITTNETTTTKKRRANRSEKVEHDESERGREKEEKCNVLAIVKKKSIFFMNASTMSVANTKKRHIFWQSQWHELMHDETHVLDIWSNSTL